MTDYTFTGNFSDGSHRSIAFVQGAVDSSAIKFVIEIGTLTSHSLRMEILLLYCSHDKSRFYYHW